MPNLICGKKRQISGIVTSAAAITFDETRGSVLLTRRSDNGRRCLLGGGMNAGESAQETCVRETLDKTRLEVRMTKPVGIYSSHCPVIEY